MNILITGACGFFGRNLVEHLAHSEHRLTLVDLQNTTIKGHLVHAMDAVHEHSRLSALMEDKDVVIHAANKARINPSWDHFGLYYDINITGSQNAFRTAQQHGVQKFVYISSSSVYGDISGPQKEADALLPTNPYGVSKLAAEHALRVQAQKGDTELIIVRPFCMYGEFMDKGSEALVLSKFITAWAEGKALTLDGGGQQTRDFIHATDAVKGLMAIVEHGKNGEVYNLGSGETVSIKELANIVSSNQRIGAARVGNVRCTHADITKIKALGFEPKVRVQDWLTNAMQDLKLKNPQQQGIAECL